MSEETRLYVDAFWKLIDEILNAVLFLLIGVEVFAIAFNFEYLTAGVAAIALALFARLAAVAVPILILRPVPRVLNRRDPCDDVGRIEGRYFCGPRPVLARGRMEARHPDCDLYGRYFSRSSCRG